MTSDQPRSYMYVIDRKVGVYSSLPREKIMKPKLTNRYSVRVLVVLLHVRFRVVGPIRFVLAASFFFRSSLYRKYYRTTRLFLIRCNSQTTELTQTRTQITPPILQSSPIKEGTRHGTIPVSKDSDGLLQHSP